MDARLYKPRTYRGIVPGRRRYRHLSNRTPISSNCHRGAWRPSIAPHAVPKIVQKKKLVTVAAITIRLSSSGETKDNSPGGATGAWTKWGAAITARPIATAPGLRTTAVANAVLIHHICRSARGLRAYQAAPAARPAWEQASRLQSPRLQFTGVTLTDMSPVSTNAYPIAESTFARNVKAIRSNPSRGCQEPTFSSCRCEPTAFPAP